MSEPIKTLLFVSLFLSTQTIVQSAESGTAVSMFMNSDGKQIAYAETKTGDLYKTMGHHGPAVENLWAAYRIYFNDSLSVDTLSKFQPRLELHKSEWYTLDHPKLDGLNYGVDNYRVGKTVGLGGLRLWDPSRKGKDKSVSVKLSKTPGSLRRAAVIQDNDGAEIRMLSKGVPFQDELLDIEFTLRVITGERFALLTAKVLSGQRIQFATGITIHDQLKLVEQQDNFLMAWGDYDSPAASEVFNVGSGLVFEPDTIQGTIRKKNEILIITKPLTTFTYLISTANAKEASDLNTVDRFRQHLVDCCGFFQDCMELSEKLNQPAQVNPCNPPEIRESLEPLSRQAECLASTFAERK